MKTKTQNTNKAELITTIFFSVVFFGGLVNAFINLI